jgi:hypothetical protein
MFLFLHFGVELSLYLMVFVNFILMLVTADRTVTIKNIPGFDPELQRVTLSDRSRALLPI